MATHHHDHETIDHNYDGGDHQAHGHSHAHGHGHTPADFGKAFLVGLVLNSAFVAAEVVFGITGHSVALLADAGHNLADVLGLAIAAMANQLSQRGPTARFTYGFGTFSILAALFNAVVLLVTVGGLSLEAIERLWHPEPVAAVTVMAVAAAGVLVNGFSAWLFAAGRDGDLNVRGAFVHLAADALVSAAVVAAGFVILATGWLWLDPLVSLGVNAVIIWGTWGLLRDSVVMALHAVPPGIAVQDIRAFLRGSLGVASVHDLHVWPISTTDTALTAHLVMPAGHPGDAFLIGLSQTLGTRFRVNHVTLQVETDETTPCALAPDHVV